MSIEVSVRENNVEQALRRLKKILLREGTLGEVKMRRYYKKPARARYENGIEVKKFIRRSERKRLARL